MPVNQQYGTLVNFFVGSTTTVEIDGLHLRKNEDADGNVSAYDNAATVILEDLETDAGVDVTGTGVPVTMTYVAASDGKYRGNFPDTAGIVLTEPPTWYRGIVKATASTGEVRRFGIRGPAIRGA